MIQKYLGWVGSVLLLAGLLLIGAKWKYAFAFTLAGELAWTVKILDKRPLAWDLLLITVVFAVIATFNLYQWAMP